MRHVVAAAGLLLGLLFVFAGMVYLLDLVPDMEPPPEGSPMAHFFAAFAPTGYLRFVKVCEVVGGVLVAIPRTRNLGLLVLVPIVVNIVAFHLFVAGDGLADPMVLGAIALAVVLLVAEHRAFLGLIAPRRAASAS